LLIDLVLFYIINPKYHSAQGYQKKFYDKGVKVKYDYKVGDLISRQNLEKLTFPKERWSRPWIIVDKNDTDGRS
jgi:hypothetical protein